MRQVKSLVLGNKKPNKRVTYRNTEWPLPEQWRHGLLLGCTRCGYPITLSLYTRYIHNQDEEEIAVAMPIQSLFNKIIVGYENIERAWLTETKCPNCALPFTVPERGHSVSLPETDLKIIQKYKSIGEQAIIMWTGACMQYLPSESKEKLEAYNSN